MSEPMSSSVYHDELGYPVVEIAVDFGRIEELSKVHPDGVLASLTTARARLREVIDLIDRIMPDYTRRAEKEADDANE